MAEYSRTSRERLLSCHPYLQKVFEQVVLKYDCTILCGHREEEAQAKAYLEGKTKLQWPQGKHNRLPSLALDAAPYPIDWKDLKRFYHFAGYVLGTADKLSVKLRWGGDWDGDRDLGDQEFNDLVHFELISI